MGLMFLAIYASAIAAVLSGPLEADGDKPPGYWNESMVHCISRSYKHDDGSWITTSTLPPSDNSEYNGGYQIIDLRTSGF